MTATTLRLGYFLSGLLFSLAFLLPLAAQRWAGAPEVLTFWLAYVLTRPLGASFADWLGVGPERGGVGLGTGLVSLALAVLACGIVSLTRFDSAAATSPRQAASPSRADEDVGSNQASDWRTDG